MSNLGLRCVEWLPVDGLASLRIGELSRRVGVSDHVLRAWETRYGLLRPTRSAGGFRLYSAADEHRVRRMKQLVADGLSAAEAARVVLAEHSPPPAADDTAAPHVAQEIDRLRAALDNFDEPGAHSVLDRLFSRLSPNAVLRQVVLPYLHELGERWADGAVNVAQEHFASNLIRNRLAGLSFGWGAGTGARALLACPPGELHDLPLMIFGITLSRLGWRVTYLGVDTPAAELLDAADAIRPEVVVLSAVAADRFEEIADELAQLGRQCALAIAGAGADATLAQRVGARLLSGDPVAEAETVARSG